MKKNTFFDGQDFGQQPFRALMPEFYPKKYQQYIETEKELISKKTNGARRVLEGGVGIGRLLPVLAPRVGEVVGIDVSELMLQKAREGAQKYPNVVIQEASLEDLSKKFPQDFFDMSLCVWNTLGNVRDEVVVLQELAAVTKDTIIVSVYLKGTLQDRTNWYQSLGIELERIDAEQEIFYTASGLRSKSYSLPDIQQLASQSGLQVSHWQILGGVVLYAELQK